MLVGNGRRRIGLVVLALALGACSDGRATAPDVGVDAGADVGVDAGVDETVRTDTATDMNVSEGAVPDVAIDRGPPADTGCTTDSDGDGIVALSCGGTDCDDGDPRRYPGNAEVCDAAGHDEDCNPCTVASATTRDGDGDGDGFVSGGCSNAYSGPSPTCDVAVVRVNGAALRVTGPDCDDTNGNVRPNQTEACNGTDDNCNGSVDEGAERVFYRDMDGDGFGDARPDTMTRMACRPPTGFAESRSDCNDSNGSISPAAPEVCDGLDNDCNLLLDGPGEDDDHDGHADNECAGVRGSDCDDWDPTIFAGAGEICDRIDQDCSVVGHGHRVRTDAPVNSVEINEDADNDRHAPLTAACTGGLLPRDDCDDTTSRVYPDAWEYCDGRDNNCDGRTDFGPGGCDVVAITPNPTYVLRSWGGVDEYVPAGMFSQMDIRPVVGLVDATQIDIGGLNERFVCARRRSGSVACWGFNQRGQLGDGTTMYRSSPTAVAGLTDATEVSCGGADPGFACARRTSGEVVCWGDNQRGQLGRGTTEPSLTPVPVLGLTDAVGISSGSNGATCALRATGSVMCWGSHEYGQLGYVDTSGTGADGGGLGYSVRPALVQGLSDATQVAMGFSGACALRRGGTVSCWGSNSQGQRGDNRTTFGVGVSSTAVGLSGIAQVAVGAFRACARTTSGQVYCWGFSNGGGLGDGTTMDRAVPVPLVDLTDARWIDMNGYSSVAIRTNGTIVGWGLRPTPLSGLP